MLTLDVRLIRCLVKRRFPSILFNNISRLIDHHLRWNIFCFLVRLTLLSPLVNLDLGHEKAVHIMLVRVELLSVSQVLRGIKECNQLGESD